MRRRSLVYAVVHDDQRVTFGHSPRPEVDRRYWSQVGARQFVPLGPPLPPMWAELACCALQGAGGAAAQTPPAGGDGRLTGDGGLHPDGPWRGLGPGLYRWLHRVRCLSLRLPLVRGRRRADGPLPWEALVDRAVSDARRALRALGYQWAALDWARSRKHGGPAVPEPDPAWAGALRPDGLSGAAGFHREPEPPSPASLAALRELLRGRLLTGAEVLRQVEFSGLSLERPLEECLTWLVVTGSVYRLPGVYPAAFGGFQCMRCGDRDQVRPWDCAACGERECWRCEACRTLGMVSACVFLYAADVADGPPLSGGASVSVPVKAGAATTGPADGNTTIPLHPRAVAAATPSARADTVATLSARVAASASIDRLPDPSRPVGPPAAMVRLPALTPAQRRAAWTLESFVRCGERREALVWAVCGAGKTEVTFVAAGHMLARGGRVLFAVPRRDVVQELGPRLAAAFPAAEIRVLHGGPGRVDRPGLAPGSLTVATTHQVLRFYRAFDLAILDEVDAYPYRGSPMLVRAVARALHAGGLLIRMSATPDESSVQEARSGKSLLVPIPARHHGHPLPVPELLVDRSLVLDDGEAGRPYRPSELVLSLVHRSLAGSPPARLLVFVPTIALAERVGRGLALALARTRWAGRVGWSHSRDPDRERKRRAFLDGHLALLVATTIMERGITVPDVDVIVLFSDVEHIFQTAALIQMAGRVGRTAARPTGRVAFVGRRVTPAMRAAVLQIEEMNRLARDMGLLSV